MDKRADPVALADESASLEYVRERWKTRLWGTGIGFSGITIRDIDGDDQTEIVLGGGYYFYPNFFWQIVSYAPDTGRYEQEWVSQEYRVGITRIVVAEPRQNGQFAIFVAFADGMIEVYDAKSRTLLRTIATGIEDSPVIAVADVDRDGAQEIIVANLTKVAVYNAATYEFERQTILPDVVYTGWRDIGVANVDDDPTPEIVTLHYVLDGATLAVEWNRDRSDAYDTLLELADIDADGKAELLSLVNGWHVVRAYDVETRTQKWEMPVYEGGVASFLLADVDHDGVDEILIGQAQGNNVLVYDSGTRALKWSMYGYEGDVSSIAVGDADNDGQTELLWGAGYFNTGGDRLYVADATTQTIEWRSDDLTGPLAAMDVGDINGDHRLEIAVMPMLSSPGDSPGSILLYDAETFKHIRAIGDEYSNDYGVNPRNTIRLDDLDDDGRDEIITAFSPAYEDSVFVYDGVTGQRRWRSPLYGGRRITALASADIDNDGQTEVLAGLRQEGSLSPDIYVVVLNGRTGAEEWRTPDLGDWVGVYSIAIGDLDGDTHPEFAFATESVDGTIGYSGCVFDGVTHQLDGQTAFDGARTVAIEDTDNDGKPELLVSTMDGKILVFDGKTGAYRWGIASAQAQIDSLHVADLNRDGSIELVYSHPTVLVVFDSAFGDIVWHSSYESSMGLGDHLVVRDLNRDHHDEIVIGALSASLVYSANVPVFETQIRASRRVARPEDRVTFTTMLSSTVGSTVVVSLTGTLSGPGHVVPDGGSVPKGDLVVAGNTITWTGELIPYEQVPLTVEVLVDATATDGAQTIWSTKTSAAPHTQFARTAVVRVDNAPPRILGVDPESGSTDVALDTPLTITLSEPVDPASVAVQCDPGLAAPAISLDSGGTMIRVTHAALAENQTYTCLVSAQDWVSHPLSGNSGSSPWRFRTRSTGTFTRKIYLPFILGGT